MSPTILPEPSGVDFPAWTSCVSARLPRDWSEGESSRGGRDSRPESRRPIHLRRPAV